MPQWLLLGARTDSSQDVNSRFHKIWQGYLPSFLSNHLEAKTFRPCSQRLISRVLCTLVPPAVTYCDVTERREEWRLRYISVRGKNLKKLQTAV